MKFSNLIEYLRITQEVTLYQATKADNVHLTIRNWVMGFYIVEYQQGGEDRAQYGLNLLKNISKELKIKGLTAPELSRCRQFYTQYLVIFGTVSQKYPHLLSDNISKGDVPSSIIGTVSQKLEPHEDEHLKNLVSSISYSHFIELIKIENPTKRRFYELLNGKNLLLLIENNPRIMKHE